MKIAAFYPIFDDCSWLARLLPLGIEMVQLRIKDAEHRVLVDQISRAKRLCEDFDCQLVVNDYWQIAIDCGCDFVHLGQEDLAQADVEAIKKAGLKLGLSSHDHTELEIALRHAPDYVALGPIYPTILKDMKWAPQGIEKIKTWKAALGDIPLVAIGGMSVERAPAAFAAGADCVSAVTDITLNESPEARVKQWLSLCNAAHSPR